MVKEHTSTVEKREKKVGRDKQKERKIKQQNVKQKDKEGKMKAVPFFPLSLLYTFFAETAHNFVLEQRDWGAARDTHESAEQPCTAQELPRTPRAALQAAAIGTAIQGNDFFPDSAG